MSEEENIPSDLLFSLAKISPDNIDSILPQIQSQASWYEKAIEDSQSGSNPGTVNRHGNQINFELYEEDEDGHVIDAAGNLVRDERTIEAYYNFYDKKKVKDQENNNSEDDYQDESNEDESGTEEEPANEDESNEDESGIEEEPANEDESGNENEQVEDEFYDNEEE